jgi:glutamyl-tRNA synthetase
MLERARFAPSPTGPLHIGGLRTALFNYLIAKKSGGSFILRIEDTDAKRTVEGAEKHIIDSLKWLGLDFDEGPVKQSGRKALYKKSVSILIEKGLAYYAFDTPNDLEKAREESGGNFKYNSTTRMEMSNSLTLTNGETESRIQRGGYSIRMVVPEKRTIKVVDQVRGDLSFNSEELEDKIIMKSDGMPTYHLANVVDDHDMKITSVIRGEEWLSSLLYEHFGWTPPKFYHLPLILKSSGAGKLSKRDADEQGHPVFAVKWEESRGFKEAGFTSEGLVNYLALLGWNNSSDKEKYTLFELIDEFNDGGINKSGARFDLKKALWVNHLHIKDFSAEKVLALSEKATTQLGEKYSSDRTEEIINLIKERLNTALDIDKELAVFIGQPKEYDQDVIEKINREIIFDVLNFCKLSEALMSNPKTLKDQLMSFGSEKGISFGNIMKTLRLCLVGNLSGPDLFKIIEFIGPEETLHRIESLTNKI